MKTLEEIDCKICGSSDSEILFKEGRDNIPINFSICKNCGFTYLNPRWTKEAYNEYYANEYDGVYRSEILKPEADSAKYETARQVHNRLQKANKLPQNPVNILDIGSGMGWSSVYFKDQVFRNANYFAIEPSLHCQENLKEQGIKVLSDDIDSNWDEKNIKFDLIIMRHVLEHFMDPVAVLKKVSNCLSEDGVLYVAVPNNNNPYSPLRTNFLRVVHTFYFDPHSITNALLMSGLSAQALVEKDPANRYELYVICKKAEQKDPIIDQNRYLNTKNFFFKRDKQEGSALGRAKIILERRIDKMKGK